MQGKNSQLQGGQELVNIQQKDVYAGSLFRKIIEAVNTLAANVSVAAVGKLSPPPPVDSIQVQGATDSNAGTVTSPSELLHFTLTHNGEVTKGVQYLTEISTDPQFSAPHVLDHGASRSGFIHLPALDNDGNVQAYYLRSYAQYHGSDPSKHTVLGGLGNPLKILMTGASKTTLLSSTGSGTAAPNGQQGGKGLGVVLTRPVQGPKRNLTQ